VECNSYQTSYPEAAMGTLFSAKRKWAIRKPTHGDKIRFAPPLIITEAQVYECVSIIEKSLQQHG